MKIENCYSSITVVINRHSFNQVIVLSQVHLRVQIVLKSLTVFVPVNNFKLSSKETKSMGFWGLANELLRTESVLWSLLVAQ